MEKRKTKRLLSFVLAASLVFSLGIVSYAKGEGNVKLKVTAPAFLAEITGYKTVPAKKDVVIENTGEIAATNVKVVVDNPNFTVIEGNNTITEGNCDTSWKIGPNAGLAKGLYIAAVTVTCDQSGPIEAKVKFRVADDMLEDVIDYLSNGIGQRIYGTPAELEAAETVAEYFSRYDKFNVEVLTVPLLNNASSQDGYMQRSAPTVSAFIEIDGAASVTGSPNPSGGSTAFSSFEGLFYDFGTYDNRSGVANPAAGLRFPDIGDVEANGGKVFGTVRFEAAATTAHGTSVVNAVKAACGATDVTGLIMARTAAGGSAPGDPQYVTSTVNLTSLNISTVGVPLKYLEKVKTAGENGQIASVKRIIPDETYVAIATKPAATSEPDLVIVLCGHIDSYIPSPGANDDLSAIAALVELARHFNDYDTGNVEIVLAAVGGEEYSGYNGSAHVGELLLSDGRRDIAINMAMDMIAAPEGAVSAGGSPINTLCMGVYMGAGNTIEPEFNLSSHLVMSFAKDSGVWTEGLEGIENVHLISYDASDHEMFGYFGIDSSRMVIGGEPPYTGGSRYSAMEQLYHTAQDTMEENWSYERNLLSCNLMRNAVEKAIELKVTKRAKFSVSNNILRLDNASQHYQTFDKIEVELVHKTNGEKTKATFVKPADTVAVPSLRDYCVNYEAVASGVGIADHNNKEMNEKYKVFTTKLHSEGAAGLIKPRPKGPALEVAAPIYEPVRIGYSRPVAKTLTIENIGDAEARIASITAPSGWTIGATNANNPQQRVVPGGKQLRRTIQPPAGLQKGEHKAPVTITYDNGMRVVAEVTLLVYDEADIVKAGIRTDAESDILDDIEYTLFLRDAKNVLSFELEFEIDGDMLTGKAAQGLSGFALLDGISWSFAGGSSWKGSATFAYPAGDSNGLSSTLQKDVATFAFSPMGVGNAAFKLTGFKASGLYEGTVSYFDSRIEADEATTNIAQRKFSKYDLNKDNKVDALDLGIMLLYCGFKETDQEWGVLVKVNDSKGEPVTAKMCDMNGDGLVDMLDLIDLFINYTK